MSDKLRELIKAINLELKKSEEIYRNTKESAQEIAASAAASPSQAGDRFHSQGTADLARQKYEAIAALKSEIDKKGEKILHKYEDETLFLVDNPVLIPGFKIVSSKSPVGKKLIDEK